MDRQTHLAPTTHQDTNPEIGQLAPIAIDLQPLLAGGDFLGSLLALLFLIYGITTSTERSLRLVMPVVNYLVKLLATKIHKPR